MIQALAKNKHFDLIETESEDQSIEEASSSQDLNPDKMAKMSTDELKKMLADLMGAAAAFSGKPVPPGNAFSELGHQNTQQTESKAEIKAH